MTLPYVARLVCLSGAAFFLVHAVLALAVRALTPLAAAWTVRIPARNAARMLLWMRLLPAVFSLFLVAAVCAPSYLYLEPKAATEPTGFACLAAATLAAAVWSSSIARAVRALIRSMRHLRECASTSRKIRVRGERAAVWIVDRPGACVMMAGVLHPRMVISRNVLESLSAGQLAAVVRHEHAHATSRDNLKRLLVLMTPDILPFFPVLRGLERVWTKTAEWAADDRAVAGRPHRSLSLAAALVRVARLGTTPAPVLATSLLSNGAELSGRVDRLLRPTARTARPAQPEPVLAAAGGLLLAGALGALIAQPAILHSAHEFLEFLIQ